MTPEVFLEFLLGVLATIITSVVVPTLLAWRQLKVAQLNAQRRLTIDAGAQKAIGGALVDVNIVAGKVSPDQREQVVDDAAKALARNYAETFEALGVKDIPAKATEVVEARLGIMHAKASGLPIELHPDQPKGEPT